MHSGAMRAPLEQGDAPQTDAALDSFAGELSDLCRKHGFGITGTATLFIMEASDYQLNYVVDAGSGLSLR